MKVRKFATATAVFAGIVLVGLSIPSASMQAQDTEATLSQIGLSISPVPMNLTGKDQTMVGLGSYLVNAVGDCNGCHTGGGPPSFNYTNDGNPYFAPTKFFLGKALPVPIKVDPTVFLAGGSNFGPVGTPTGPNMYQGPFMIARNLTPDKNGVPEGGMTLDQFRAVFSSGTDFDHVHPVCTAAQITLITSGATPPPVCIPTSPDNPTNGNVLQIMPWPTFSHMTQRQIDSIYMYLSTIPCIDNNFAQGADGDPTGLRNDCGTTTSKIISSPPLAPYVRRVRR